MPDTLTPPNGGSGGGLSRGLRILLIASLALNMFLLGAGAVLLGRALFAPPMPPGPRFMERGGMPSPMTIFKAMPEASRERLERDFKEERTRMRRAIGVARKARREAYEAFTAEPFVPTALTERLRRSREADLAAVGAVHELMGQLTQALSPEERQLVAAEVRRRADRRKEHWGKEHWERRKEHWQRGALPPEPSAPPPDGPPPDGPVGDGISP